MSDRNAFLSRVRQASEQGRPYRVHVEHFPDETGYVGAGGDLCERLAAEVNAVGGQAFVVPDLPAAGDQLRMLLKEEQARSAVCWDHELLGRLKLADLLGSLEIDARDYHKLTARPPAEQRAALLECDVGITSCDCAIAETGTLMMCSRPGQERTASLLPPVHIAIVERRQIVPDLIDAFGQLTDRGIDMLPSNVTLITGPSKTGDIELQLTTGVHGPGKWKVVIIAN
jgi:L-lactate dehydrogenase complex protein LldG